MNKLKFARKRVLPFLCIMLLSISLRGQEASKGDFSEKFFYNLLNSLK